MRNRGLANPQLGAFISAALAIGGAAAVWWGIAGMQRLGAETTATATAIALGGLIGFFGLIYFINCLWALRIYGALHRGEGVVGNWVVAPATFALFRDQEAKLRQAGHDNDYPLPRQTPRDGVPVWFGEDGVLIGERYFGLASTGLARFDAVALRPGMPNVLEFSTVLTVINSQPRVAVRHHGGVLRVPVDSRSIGEAQRVLAHYDAVIERRRIVKPHFWTLRLRIGLGAAVLGGLAAVIGFALREHNQALADVPAILAVAGAVVGLGGVILAFGAALQRRRQRYG